MEDLERNLDRASNKLDPATFSRLFRLTRERHWLEPLTDALAELWNLCHSDKERDLIEDLLKRFRCVTSSEFNLIGQQTAAHICTVWGLTERDTLIVATSDNPDADGSQAFIQSLKNKFSDHGDWAEANFCNGMTVSLRKVSETTNVVLVDDFIGTGKQISRRVRWYREKLKGSGLNMRVKLYVVAVAGMEFARPALDLLDVNYYCPIWLKKGITEHYLDLDLEQAVTDMCNLEERLESNVSGKSLSKYSFGYQKSETLFSIESLNVPNNVFPIFWWPEIKMRTRRKTLFKRLMR